MIVVRTKNSETRDARRGSSELQKSDIMKAISNVNSRRTDITGEGTAILSDRRLELPLHAITILECVC